MATISGQTYKNLNGMVLSGSDTYSSCTFYRCSLSGAANLSSCYLENCVASFSTLADSASTFVGSSIVVSGSTGIDPNLGGYSKASKFTVPWVSVNTNSLNSAYPARSVSYFKPEGGLIVPVPNTWASSPYSGIGKYVHSGLTATDTTLPMNTSYGYLYPVGNCYSGGATWIPVSLGTRAITVSGLPATGTKMLNVSTVSPDGTTTSIYNNAAISGTTLTTPNIVEDLSTRYLVSWVFTAAPSTPTITYLAPSLFPFTLDSNTLMAYDFTAATNGASTVDDLTANNRDLSIRNQSGAITGNASTIGTSSTMTKTSSGWSIPGDGTYGVYQGNFSSLVSATSLTYEVTFKLNSWSVGGSSECSIISTLGEIAGSTYGFEMAVVPGSQVFRIVTKVGGTWQQIFMGSYILGAETTFKAVLNRSSNTMSFYQDGVPSGDSPMSIGGMPSFNSAFYLTVGRRSYQWASNNSTMDGVIKYVSVSSTVR